ncbi:MAG TPA: hypothetical protein VLG50_07775 [Candidatus Saccharimonadales bacterium]|nr:hypothetical protein [Candidatus Saccharimonadales bacterium]
MNKVTNDIIYETLLNTDIQDLYPMCQINKQYSNICHSKQFLITKFNQLHIKIYKNIKLTLNNLIFIDRLIQLAYHVVEFIKQSNKLFYYGIINTISDMSKISPLISNKIMDKLKNEKEMNINKNDKLYGRFEANTYIEFNNHQMYLEFWMYTPDDYRSSIILTDLETVEFLVNLFLDEHRTYYRKIPLNKLQFFINASMKAKMIIHDLMTYMDDYHEAITIILKNYKLLIKYYPDLFDDEIILTNSDLLFYCMYHHFLITIVNDNRDVEVDISTMEEIIAYHLYRYPDIDIVTI